MVNHRYKAKIQWKHCEKCGTKTKHEYDHGTRTYDCTEYDCEVGLVAVWKAKQLAGEPQD